MLPFPISSIGAPCGSVSCSVRSHFCQTYDFDVPTRDTMDSYGRFRIRLDAKGRLTLPALYRRSLGVGDPTDEAWLVLLQGNDGCIRVMPAPEFDELVRSGFAEGKGSDPEYRAQRRQLLSSVENASLDSKGRMTVPSELLKKNGIGRDVLVVGVGRLMEFWDPETFFELDKQTELDTAPLDDLLYG